MTESKKQYSPEDFEPYFVGIMDMFAEIKDILLNETIKPSIALFNDYNRIVSATPEQLDAMKAELTGSLEKTRAAFQNLKKKTSAIKAPDSTPPALKVFVSAARDKSREHILDSLKASEILLSHLDGRDPAELAKAHQLLGKMVI